MTPPTEGDDYKPTPDGFPAVKFDSPTEGGDPAGFRVYGWSCPCSPFNVMVPPKPAGHYGAFTGQECHIDPDEWTTLYARQT